MWKTNSTLLVLCLRATRMGVCFKEFAFRNMLWLGNTFWVLVSGCLVRILWALCTKVSRVSNERSEIGGVGTNEVRQNPDDRNGSTGGIFGGDSGLPSVCEDESSFDSLSVSNAIASKYEFLAGNSFCGYVEEPQNTSFKIQELFLGFAFEQKAEDDSVITKHSVCGDFQEFDDQKKTGDSVVREVDEQEKIEELICIDTSLDKDFREVGNQAEMEVFLSSEQSVGKDFGEVDNQVKSKVPVTDEPSLLKDSGEMVDEVKADVSVCGELSSGEDYRQVDDMGKTEASICCEPSLDEDVHPVDDGGEAESSISVSSCEEEEESPAITVSVSKQGEIVRMQDYTASRDEIAVKSCFSCEANSEKEELISLDPDGFSEKADIVSYSNGVQPSWEAQLLSSDYVNQEPSRPSNDFWHTNGEFISGFDGVYSYQSADEVLAPKTPMCRDTKSVDLHEEDATWSNSTDSDDHEDSDMNHTEAEEEYWEKSNELDMEEKNNQVLDEDDEVDFDVLLQHQLFVQKMKKEMKHFRVTGLPTILEESESPRMDEDFKPLKIDEKVGYKDRLDEIQRFYRSYLDKMRRLDILSHQTMYALGFLQLKNQDQLTTNKKLSLPSVKSVLANNFWLNKFRRHESDPVQKLLRDLHRDLELVYVGQLCLSWEILKWQHARAEELQLYDTMGLRQYSLAAGEFQQFQVLVQRFTEDEPFQGPRVENFVKNRCSNCYLLQVPPIKDDSKNVERKGEGQGVVSIVRLADIIEESMHAFWELVRADKKEVGNVGMRDPLDAELLCNIRTNLAKKERRLKDIVRSGNCIAKKFQKQQDCQLTHELLLAQVELRLVSRVIGMSRLTAEQLLWCQKKLSKISIVGRKAQVESSFLLFPC